MSEHENVYAYGIKRQLNCQREIYQQRLSDCHLNIFCSSFLCKIVVLCAFTYTQHVIRVWSILGVFLKARINKVSKVIRPAIKSEKTESKLNRHRWHLSEECMNSKNNIFFNKVINKVLKNKVILSLKCLWFNRFKKKRSNCSHHSLDCSVGLSFCAMWYKALIAFILNNGGFLSAEKEMVRQQF